MQEQYQKAIDSMTERLQRLEARPPAAPPQAAAAPALPARTGTPSLVELTRPREPFVLYERRGSGQLLFDFGMVADFVGNLVGPHLPTPGSPSRLQPNLMPCPT